MAHKISSVLPDPPVSHLESIRKLTVELVGRAAVDSLITRPSSFSQSHLGKMAVTVSNNVSSRLLLDQGFFKVAEFWIAKEACIPSVIQSARSWYFIIDGTSIFNHDGKRITVSSGDVVYFDVGGMFGDFRATNKIHGVVVSVEPQ